MRPSIEYLCDALEVLLPCCIPDLQFDLSFVDFEEECSELHTNRDLVVLHELIGRDPVHETRLAYSRIANHDELEKVVELLRG